MATVVYDKIFAYCERGQDPSFWAEPLNAVSNVGFVIAGLFVLWSVGRLAPLERSLYAWTLALLALLIGVGSFLFHTVAVSWAGAMDVIPILIFMLVAVYGLGRRLIGWPIWAAWLGLGVYLASGVALGALPLEGLFWISKGYFPALIALGLGGWALSRRPEVDRQIAGRYMLAAGAVFTVSLTFRTLDAYQPLCDAIRWNGSPLGTHYWWHLLNAVTLYLVMRAFWEQEARAASPAQTPETTMLRPRDLAS
ncbi:MAG: ceramidase domain-containing protein [Pseudomonadota bacterium]